MKYDHPAFGTILERPKGASQLRVGFDLDGVLHNFGDGVRQYLASIGREFGYKDGAAEAHSWDFFDYWHMTPAEFVQVCNDGVDAGFIFNGNVRPNAVETVNMVKAMGHKIIVITDRQFGATPSASHERTIKWWNDNNFAPLDEIYFSADKTCAPTDIFVEDKLSNYDAITAAGTECWLINRPWNQVDELDTRLRMDDISDYVGKVFRKTFQSTKN